MTSHARGICKCLLLMSDMCITPIVLGFVQALGFPLQGAHDIRPPLGQAVGRADELRLRAELRDAAGPESAASRLGHWLEGRILDRRRRGSRVASRMSLC